MRVSRDTLRGYILEEVLAYLIQNTGYRLLVHPDQDPQELGWRGNGLVVHGRGAEHQVDVLGELRWVPAFTYPLRLFVEAKFRGGTTGIGVVRNMVSVLLDLNQNNLPRVDRRNGATPQLRPKYHYVGAVFSTSGFSVPAMDLALAHGVSLIDLGTSEFQPLLDAISQAADRILALDDRVAVPNDEVSDLGDNVSSTGRQLAALRGTIRETLGTNTWHARVRLQHELEEDFQVKLRPALRAARDVGELLVGMGRGPYMLVLKADDREEFLRYSRQNPSHEVWIRWDTHYDDGRTWIIHPAHDHDAYRLTFRLPQALADAIFSSENIQRAALDVKQALMSEILIYRHHADRDSLIRLRFNPSEIHRR